MHIDKEDERAKGWNDNRQLPDKRRGRKGYIGSEFGVERPKNLRIEILLSLQSLLSSGLSCPPHSVLTPG